MIDSRGEVVKAPPDKGNAEECWGDTYCSVSGWIAWLHEADRRGRAELKSRQTSGIGRYKVHLRTGMLSSPDGFRFEKAITSIAIIGAGNLW